MAPGYQTVRAPAVRNSAPRSPYAGEPVAVHDDGLGVMPGESPCGQSPATLPPSTNTRSPMRSPIAAPLPKPIG